MQVRAADVVVLNKCDVATLSAISDVEDRLQALAPGIRLLRARFGQVPLEAVLDVEVQQAQEGAGAASSGNLPASGTAEAGSDYASSSAAGEVAFLSHEGFLGQPPQGQRQKHTGGSAGSPSNCIYCMDECPCETLPCWPAVWGQCVAARAQPILPTTSCCGWASRGPCFGLTAPYFALCTGVRRKRPAVPAASGRAPEGTHTDHQHRHSDLHRGFQSVSVVQEAPLCMACFQRFVQQHLVHAEGEVDH